MDEFYSLSSNMDEFYSLSSSMEIETVVMMHARYHTMWERRIYLFIY